MRGCLLLTLLGVSLASGAAPAAGGSGDQIAGNAGCTMCHAIDKKVMGPSFHDIGAKYRADPKAAATLAGRVRAGSKGVWGPASMMPMDASTISDADLHTVISWILKQ